MKTKVQANGPSDESPADREDEFWQGLDTEKPGLVEVKKTLAGEWRKDACHALVAYYRDRVSPALGRPLKPGSTGTIQRAKETLDHTYRLAGCKPCTFEDSPHFSA